MAVFLLAVLSWSLIAPTLGDLVTAEEMFDYIFSNSVQKATRREMPIPDLDRQLYVNLFLKSVAASLHATKGSISDLTTMHRVGPVRMAFDFQTRSASFVAPMSLRTLSVAFRNYTMEASVFRFSGDRLIFDVGRNVFEVTMLARMSQESCDVEIRDVQVVDFGDVNVDITGFSYFNKIARVVGKLFIAFFNNLVKGLADIYTQNIVRGTTFRTAHMCRKLYNVALDNRNRPVNPFRAPDNRGRPVNLYIGGQPLEISYSDPWLFQQG